MKKFLGAILAVSVAHFCAMQASAEPASLSQAARSMGAYLDSMPEPNQKGWKAYFNWDAWGPALASGQVDLEVLKTATPQFYGFHEGLEQKVFQKMRDELDLFLQSQPHLKRPSPAGTFPQLFLRTQRSLVEEALLKGGQTTEQSQYSGHWIAGAWVTGISKSLASATPRLTTFNGQAAVEIQVKGTVQSPDSVAHKGPFRMHSSAVSAVNGVAYLYLDKDQVRATEPVVTASTQSTLGKIEGPRLLQGIARRQAGKKRGQAERESSQIVASEAAEQMKSQIAEQVAEANRQFKEFDKYKVLLNRIQMEPLSTLTGLSSNSIQVGLRLPGGGAAAPLGPRALRGGDTLEISMHESLLGSIGVHVLGGAWWTDESFFSFQKELTGTSANELLIGVYPERWAVQWDWARPALTRITPEWVEYELGFSAAIVDGVRWPGVRVTAKYKPLPTRSGLEFQRLGSVELKGALSPEQAEFYRRKFSALLGESVYLDGLNPPAGGGWDTLSGYFNSSVQLEAGWLHIGYAN